MKTLESVIFYVKNKIASFIAFAVMILAYSFVPYGTPFAELLYTAVTVFGVIVTAPLVRLLVFNEAALYAEGGQLERDLTFSKCSPALLHYWFATAISYAAPIACIAGISK